jgi:hypothetical protein
MPNVAMSDEEMRRRKTQSGAKGMGTLLTGTGGTTNTTQGGMTLLGGSAPLSGSGGSGKA